VREELRPKGIRVIALMPGATDTDLGRACGQSARHKMMSAETVARMVVNALLMPEKYSRGKGSTDVIRRPAITQPRRNIGMAKVAFSDANA